MTKNPIKIAEDLQAVLVEIQKNIVMADTPKRNIATIYITIGKLITELKRIHENIVPLDVTIENGIPEEHREIWYNLSPGRTSEKSENYTELLKHSETLTTLYKNAIDIISVYKFSPEELQFSETIAGFFSDNFDEFKQIRWLISMGKYGEQSIRTTVENSIRLDKFLQALISFNLVEKDYMAELYVYSKKQWMQKKIDDLSRVKSKGNKVKFNISLKKSNALRDIISGHWFNAFAYSVISDHLTRNTIPHEIYTRVEYKSPTDIFNAKGDFDILSMAQDKILVVECKSSDLKDDSMEMKKVIDKKIGLEKVFDSVKSDYYEYIFLFIYNPLANNSETVLERLIESGIKPLRPDEVRGAIADIYHRA